MYIYIAILKQIYKYTKITKNAQKSLKHIKNHEQFANKYETYAKNTKESHQSRQMCKK